MDDFIKACFILGEEILNKKELSLREKSFLSELDKIMDKIKDYKIN